MVSHNVAEENLNAITSSIDLVADITNGEITANLIVVDDEDPRPAANEVTVAVHASPSSKGCGSDIGWLGGIDMVL